MTQNAKTASACPKCGRSLPVDAPRGLCSKCLFSAMLDGPLVAPPNSTNAKATFPREFGSYVLLEEVARGGMGIVYKARQTLIDRVVALKIMAGGQFAEPDFVKRFRTEAEAVAKLDYPNIVPIYEIGECEGQPFFSMRLVEGGSLSVRIANTKSPIPEATAVEILVALSRAVHYAHQRGILHRDIKPGNVLLDAQGKPYLTDFGLAKLVEKDSTLTRTMAMLGTPSYMSPEQARGEAKQLTVAVDVYGLGAILYELLTGQPPFGAGTTMKTVRQVLEQEPRQPSALKPGLDRDLETICLKCLEKDPTRRYGSAEALANDLERWLGHEPILARPATPLERAAKWVRRHPVGAAFSATLLIVIASSVIMLARANMHIRAAQRQETALRHEAERKAEENRQQLVRLSVSTGNRLVDEGDYFRALLWFSEATRLENGDASREDIHRRRFGTVLHQSPGLAQIWFHNEIIQIADFSLGGDRVLSTGLTREVHIWDVASGNLAVPTLRHTNDVTGAKFSPDGRHILTLDSRRKVHLWDAATGELLELPGSLQRAEFRDIEFSRDGKWMALAGPKGIQLCDAASGELGPLLASTNGAVFCSFAPSSRLLGAAQKREVELWTLTSGEWSRKTLTLPADVWRFTFSHDEKWIATTTARQICVWDVATGEKLHCFDSPGSLYDCQFSPDGRWLAAASWSPNVRLFGTDDFQERNSLMRHRTGISRSRFSDDSQRLATCSWDFTARIWNPNNGEPASPWLVHGGYVLALNFSPDSSRLVTAGQDQTVRLWNLRKNDGAQLKVRHEKAISSLQFSPDGERLFTCGRDGRANIWDAQSGRLLLALPRQSQEIAAGSLSPDGTMIVTASADGVRLWNSQTGEQIGTTLGQSNGFSAALFSADGRRVVGAGTDRTLFVWNTADGSLVTQMATKERLIAPGKLSPGGVRVLTGGDGTARIWDIESGKAIGQPMKHPGQVVDADFSPDGRRVVTACSDRTQFPRAAQMWDTITGAPLGPEMPHRDGVLCVEFSPDGKLIATGGEDRVAIVWDAATGKRLTPGMSHPSYVSRVKFSPDSRLLLTLGDTGSATGFARVWEVATGEPVTPPLLHSTGLTEGAWSPDGRQIALAGNDGTATFWDVSAATGSIESLRQQAEVLSAHRIEPNHSLLPLSAKEMRERWEATKASQSR